MLDLNEYIGIPFFAHGRDKRGLDCYGLTKLVLQERFNKTLPDFHAYEDTGDRDAISALMNLNVPLLAGTKKEIPDVGDIALFRFYGVITHIGVYVGNGMVLHILRGSNSVIEKISGPRLKGRLEGYYEIK